jgi:hypothetical protein
VLFRSMEETSMKVSASRLIFLGEFHTSTEQVLDVIFRVESVTSRKQQPVKETSGSLIELCFIPIGKLTRTPLEPRRFWKSWIPRLIKHRDIESFEYGGIYED